MSYYRFNTEYNVLTDEQGILVPKSNAMELVKQLQEHFSHTPLEMEAIGRRMLTVSHPSMVNQFNFEWFDYFPEKVVEK
jgi:hypothetical protein